MTQKRALITGASEGIGRAFAKALAEDGYAITAVARSQGRLQSLLTEMKGGEHSFRAIDLAEPSGVEALAREVREGGYSLLVNNAGFGLYGKFDEIPLDKWQQMMRLNCDALVALSHAFLGRAKRGDALVNVASTLGFMAFPASSVYAATKSFVVSLSESLWFEQKDKGVYVMALCPGVTQTDFHHRAGGDEKNRPPQAIMQTPEEVVEEAMHALRTRTSPTVISGFKNEMMVFATRLVNRKTVVNIMGSLSAKARASMH